MPPRADANHGSLRLMEGRLAAVVLDHPLPSRQARPKRRTRQRKHSIRHIPREEARPKVDKTSTFRNNANMKKFLSGKMKVFQSMSMPCCKKHTSGMKDGEATSLDPLAAIIEEAKNITCSKRVRLVHFNLGRNQVIDESTRPKAVRSGAIAAPRASILSPSTTPSSRNSSDIKKLRERVFFDPDADTSKGSPSQPRVDDDGPTRTSQKDKKFKVDITLTSRIKETIRKGSKYQKVYNYPKAAKSFLQALKKLDHHLYPQDHPLREIANRSISDTHHAHRSLEHSANIVKIGLGNESNGQLVKAVKMYTVAFRIRKDSLGDGHPSLPVLLNLLGGVQIKRKQYEEAMQIFELALYGKLKKDTTTVVGKRNVSASTLAVSMKEIGSIHEHYGRLEEAMIMYHESLDCVLKDARRVRVQEKNSQEGPAGAKKHLRSPPSVCSTANSDESYDVCVVSASTLSSQEEVPEEMEIYLQESFSGEPHSGRNLMHLAFFYDSFFQITEMKSKKVNLHVANTLHSIASIHLKQQEFNLALSSYHASLRGMKLVHGERHESVAAVLGNIGNLLKEMKDYDRAFDVYQSVLKIESLRLGSTHHNAMVTMLNIAMIEKCRRQYDASIALYNEVIILQRNKYHDDDQHPNLLAVALSCVGDVYEKRGDFESSIGAFKEILAIQTINLAPFHPDLGKILHRLGLLCSDSGQLLRADSYFTKALRLYRKNDVNDERMIGVKRDKADNRSKLSLMNTPVNTTV